MTQDEFQDGLDRWGFDFTQWPSDLRATAETVGA